MVNDFEGKVCISSHILVYDGGKGECDRFYNITLLAAANCTTESPYKTESPLSSLENVDRYCNNSSPYLILTKYGKFSPDEEIHKKTLSGRLHYCKFGEESLNVAKNYVRSIAKGRVDSGYKNLSMIYKNMNLKDKDSYSVHLYSDTSSYMDIDGKMKDSMVYIKSLGSLLKEKVKLCNSDAVKFFTVLNNIADLPSNNKENLEKAKIIELTTFKNKNPLFGSW